MPVPFLLEEMPVRKENERLPADVVVLTLLVESLRCGKEISLPVLQLSSHATWSTPCAPGCLSARVRLVQIGTARKAMSVAGADGAAKAAAEDLLERASR